MTRKHRAVFGGVVVAHLDGARMLDLVGGSSLFEKAVPHLGIDRELGVEHLDRHLLAVVEVGSRITLPPYHLHQPAIRAATLLFSVAPTRCLARAAIGSVRIVHPVKPDYYRPSYWASDSAFSTRSLGNVPWARRARVCL